MKRRIVAACACAAALFSSPLAPARADDPDSSFVRQHAIDMLEDALSGEQIAKLNLIAHQVAVAAVCEGVSLDEAKFTKAFEALAPENAAEMSDEQKDYHDKHLLVIYGVLVGGELAAMSDDPGAACAAAAETKADPEMADELVWQ